MSLPWFRFYREVKDDPKMGAISDSSFRVFCESLCWACEKENHGGTGLTRSSANWAFRRDVTAALNELFSVGLLCESSSGEIIVPKWEDRQSTLDSSRGRVAKYRERLKMAGAGGDYEQHRDAVYLRDGGRCVYCGSSENLCIDHMKPIIRGGTNEILNLATACKACNSGKSGRTPEEAGYSFFNKETEKMYVTVTKSKCNGYSNIESRSCHGAEESRVEESRVDKTKTLPVKVVDLGKTTVDSGDKHCSTDACSIFEQIDARSGALFGRTGPATAYAEQCVISEVSRRPGAIDEMSEIEVFHRKPGNYFPQSLQRLLEKWEETLDRARTYDTRKKNISTSTKVIHPEWSPNLSAVTEYSKEKWGDDNRHIGWAVSFHTFWSDQKRNWQRAGTAIDWKIELGKQVSKWRTQ